MATKHHVRVPRRRFSGEYIVRIVWLVDKVEEAVVRQRASEILHDDMAKREVLDVITGTTLQLIWAQNASVQARPEELNGMLARLGRPLAPGTQIRSR